MKKILLSLSVVAIAAATTSCNKNNGGETAPTYPGDSLVVEDKTRPLVLETTGAWCQYCPNGAEIMIGLEAYLGHDAVLLANHVGDYFATGLTNNVEALFSANFPAQGVPNFYVNNEDVGQSPTASASAGVFVDPDVGVAAEVTANDSGWVVTPRVEFFENVSGTQYLINAYLSLDSVAAKDYGNGVDLNQTSSVSSVTTGSGTAPTIWATDAAVVNGVPVISQGDVYYHTGALNSRSTMYSKGWSEDPNSTVETAALSDWGLALSDVNPLMDDFAAGDVFGTRYTPFQLHVARPTIAPLESNFSIHVIIWKVSTDVAGQYDYVNGVTVSAD